MSNAVFPTFAGYPSFPIGKIANWGTRQQRSVSGRTLRSSDYVNPIWNWTLIYPGLHDYPFCSPPINPAGSFLLPITEFRTIQDFYNSRAGAFDPFLFEDPTDNNTINDAMVPAPDDTTGQIFQLVRRLAPLGRPEWITAPNVISSITIGGAPTTAYTQSPAGLLTFASVPGATPMATFSYYFPVRFTDALDAQQFLHNLWELKQVKLQSVVALGRAAPAAGGPILPPAPPPGPLSQVPQAITLVPSSATVLDTAPAGMIVARATVVMPGGAVYTGPIQVSGDSLFIDSGLNVVTARAVATTDDGLHSVVVSAGPVSALPLPIIVVAPVPFQPPPAPTLTIAMTPAFGAILDSTPLGTVVATITVTRSDGLPFGGTVGFGMPYFDDGGRFIITGSNPGPFNLVLNPSGPGLPASRSTEFVTITAVP